MINLASCKAVERDIEVVSWAWVFQKTRVPISALFENLEDGITITQFVQWFPGVTIDQVKEVLEHVAQSATASVA